MKQSTALRAAPAALVLAFAASSHALPDARQGNPLSSMGLSTPEGIGDVLVDHENPETLYVGPANSKTLIGSYAEIDASGPQCADFVNLRRQTYLTPTTSEQKDLAFENDQFVSNYYQLTYALPKHNTDSLNILREIRTDIVRLRQTVNPEYFAVNSRWYQLIADMTALEAEKDDLGDENMLRSNRCLAQIVSNPTGAIACLQDTNQWYTEELEKIDEPLRALKQQKLALQDRYYELKGEFLAIEAEGTALNSDMSFYRSLYDAQSSVIDAAWQLERDVLLAEEGKIVGRSSAAYNLFDDEAATLQQALLDAGKHDYGVKQLDVFDVQLNPGVQLENPSVVGDDGTPLFQVNTFAFSADTLVRNSLLGEASMAFEAADEATPRTLYYSALDEKSFASGGIDFFVSKGARCGEYTQEVEETYESTSDEGPTVRWRVTNRLYEPQPDRVIFSQSLGLSYNYYSFPGPLRGSCTIDVDRMNDYVREQGKTKKWRWFKTKTNSWDRTREVAKNDFGMECELDVKPLSDDPEEARQMEEEYERAMYEETWQMFLTAYAKEYEVEVVDPGELELVQSTVGTNLSTGLNKICPTNVYCQVTGLVLKTLDEMGGSRAQGSTSHISRQYGRISRSFDKNVWAVKQGSASLLVKSCVDDSQCD